jgi:large subunit ribosomal protein L31
MKQDIHPEYREVVFLDMSSGKKFLCRSTVKTFEEVEFEGKKYPCMKISISSDSHPFYTGDQTFVDTEGRVDKFKKRYERKGSEEKKESVEASKEDKKDSSHKKEPKEEKVSSKEAEEKKSAAKKAPVTKEKKAESKKAGAKEAGK